MRGSPLRAMPPPSSDTCACGCACVHACWGEGRVEAEAGAGARRPGGRGGSRPGGGAAAPDCPGQPWTAPDCPQTALDCSRLPPRLDGDVLAALGHHDAYRRRLLVAAVKPVLDRAQGVLHLGAAGRVVCCCWDACVGG